MPPLANDPLPAPASSAKRMSRAQAMWLHGIVLVSFLAASSAPSPLYAIYREAWGFSALTLTLVFSSYAFALLAALLVLGGLSDHRGRREVVLLSLALEFASVVMFWRADSVGWLLAARILQGLATGIATSTLSAAMLDLNRERGSLVNGIAPMIGMAIGALGTSALVQFAPAPTKLVFELLLLALALQAVAAYFLPETVELRPGVWQSLKPKLAIPQRARSTLWQLLPVNTALWALGGFYLSLGPTLAKLITGSAAPVVGGALIATLVLSAAVSIYGVRERPPRATLAAGAAAFAIGLVVTLSGMQWHLTSLFFIGTAMAGVGFGASFNGAMRSLVPLAAPHERAGLMASFFVLSYLAFSVPAIAAGLAVGLCGLKPTAMGYGVMLVAMALAALLAMKRWRRSDFRSTAA